MTRTLLSNGVDTDGNKLNVLIDGERIAALSRDASQISVHDAEVIDMQGKTLAPTLVDLHTHLREPGKEDAETVQSGSASAVRGGFGAISGYVTSFRSAQSPWVKKENASQRS
jgi:dihydroorotase